MRLQAGDAALADLFDQLARNAGRRSLLHHLLVAPLHRAVALAQVHGVLVLVGQHLDFDVPRVLQVLLEVDRWIAERGAGLGLGHLHRVDQRRFGVDDPHAPAAAAARCLDDHGVAHRLRQTPDLHRVIGQLAFRAGYARHARLDHGLLGRDLVAHDADRFRRRPDELEPALFDPLGKVGVLREEAVARVDRLRIGHFRRRNDGGHVEIALGRLRRADAHGLLGQLDVLGLRGPLPNTPSRP